MRKIRVMKCRASDLPEGVIPVYHYLGAPDAVRWWAITPTRDGWRGGVAHPYFSSEQAWRVVRSWVCNNTSDPSFWFPRAEMADSGYVEFLNYGQ